MSDVFLLGCERSGSTWLANIFDAHPDVELVMEPFADYTRLFPGIPDRNTHAGEPSRSQCAAVREGYEQLASIKYPLLYRPGRPVWLRRAEQCAVAALRRPSRRLLGRVPPFQDRYQLLQLNSLATPVARMTRKNRLPGARVTKELRLNFKVPLLCAAFSEPRFIVVLRNPSAQIASILGWMERGQLGELGRALGTFSSQMAGQARFAPLVRALGSPGSHDEIEKQLAVWWALNYSVLLEDLERCGADYQLARHERLAQHASGEVARLIGFAGLTPDPAVDRYVAWSTHTDPRGNSATETVRRSAEFSSEAIRNAPERVTTAVKRVLDRLGRAQLLHEQLAESYAGLAA
jgi:hypothetical protein